MKNIKTYTNTIILRKNNAVEVIQLKYRGKVSKAEL